MVVWKVDQPAHSDIDDVVSVDVSSTLFVIPCGAAKLARPSLAEPLHRGDVRYSLAVVKEEAELAGAAGRRVAVRILSARHGPLDPDTLIDAYDQRMTNRDAIPTTASADQLTSPVRYEPADRLWFAALSGLADRRRRLLTSLASTPNPWAAPPSPHQPWSRRPPWFPDRQAHRHDEPLSCRPAVSQAVQGCLKLGVLGVLHAAHRLSPQVRVLDQEIHRSFLQSRVTQR